MNEIPSSSVPASAERAAKTGLAVAWLGFLLAFVYVIAMAIEGEPGAKQCGLRIWSWILAYAYWLFCVYRMNAAIRRATGGQHPIIPSQAVTFHFVPVFNLFWIFKWTNAVGSFLRSRGQTFVTGEGGFYILVAFAISTLDSLLSLLALFGFMCWFNLRVRKAILTPHPAAQLGA